MSVFDNLGDFQLLFKHHCCWFLIFCQSLFLQIEEYVLHRYREGCRVFYVNVFCVLHVTTGTRWQSNHPWHHERRQRGVHMSSLQWPGRGAPHYPSAGSRYWIHESSTLSFLTSLLISVVDKSICSRFGNEKKKPKHVSNPFFFPAANYCICIIRVVHFHYLYWKALTVVAFQSTQLSGVLMYVTQLLSLCQSVNSSVWGLRACVCACSFCTAMCVQQDLSVWTSLSVSGPLTRLSARHRSDRWLRCQPPVLSVSWYCRAEGS